MIDSTQQSKASIFPCDCGTEGLVVVAENEAERKCEGAPFITITFMGVGSYADGRLSWIDRIRLIWRLIRTGNPYTDMVTMRSNVAKNFAYHILYLLSRQHKIRVRDIEPKYLVNDGLGEDAKPTFASLKLPPTWGKLS